MGPESLYILGNYLQVMKNVLTDPLEITCPLQKHIDFKRPLKPFSLTQNQFSTFQLGLKIDLFSINNDKW